MNLFSCLLIFLFTDIIQLTLTANDKKATDSPLTKAKAYEKKEIFESMLIILNI